jgi:toxin FitB
MSGFLLDTNCISELVRNHPDPSVVQWVDSTDESLLYLSVLTLGEIRKGIATLAASVRRTKLETWLEVELKTRFAGRILPIDGAVADRWGILAAATKKTGKSLSAADGLLAATAIHNNLSIVTRNVGDFAIAQVQVVNPWQE